MRTIVATGACLAAVLLPLSADAHAPSVIDTTGSSPAEAIVLEDPTLSRAIGATIEEPGEVDWYRMDLQAGDPIVLGMTAPDATGGIAATFTLVGPGLPDASLAGPGAETLTAEVDATGVLGAIDFQPAADPRREVHGGLGFINYGTVRAEAPAAGSYWIAVRAVDPQATGKYVFAPGLREEFGIDAIAGMLDLVAFFNAPWPPEAGD